MPTFMFYRNKTKIDSLRGADQNALEEKVKKWYDAGAEGDESEECAVKGHVSISSVRSQNLVTLIFTETTFCQHENTKRMAHILSIS